MKGSDSAGRLRRPGRAEEEGEPAVDRLIAELEAEHGPYGPVGGAVRAAARAAYAARRDDAVLTEIGDDSVSAAHTRVRDSAVLAGEPRYLRFDAPQASVGLEVTVLDEDRLLVGRIDPPGPTEAEIRTAQGSAWTPVDEHGAFVAPAVPAGPISLVLHHPDDRPVATPWLTI
ncbi:hypothetical protein FZ103_17580 [Streptomonospora sp. PA3]|uniref:hypothetical protein n=1 Tax=Streptomonospora sp. PA3 TaxID=2607326 RepID=UPI0012DF864C|nr:hypothetical protein [Streptomonospora sp. PA3]MUL42957.1 hypothetical protein [Streptomonospora sp. PA3]